MTVTNIRPNVPAPAVGIGAFFQHVEGELYIVAEAGGGRVILVCLNDGIHYAGSTPAADKKALTRPELENLFGSMRSRFTRVEVAGIFVK